MSAPPSGAQFTIAHGPFEATAVEVGGGLRTFGASGRPILQGYRAEERCAGARGQLLVPWPNRIAAGTYAFAGTSHQLATTEPSTGCAIHGLVRWANWRCLRHDRDRVVLTHRLHPRPGWPGVLDLAVDYRVDERGLAVALTADNVGDTPVPYGAGAHPYLVAGDGPVDDWTLTMPASTMLETDGRGIPVSRVPVVDTDRDLRAGRRLEDLQLDHAFGDLARGDDGITRVTLDGPAGRVGVWADSHHSWFQVFTGDRLADVTARRTAVAIEPMTCPPDAFNTGEDLILLAPGASVTIRWGITAS